MSDKVKVENLKNVEKINYSGRYQYLGFFLSNPDTFEEGEKGEIISKTLGEVTIIFNDEKGKLKFVRNSDILGANSDTPYGEFQKSVGEFTKYFDVVLQEDGVYSIK